MNTRILRRALMPALVILIVGAVVGVLGATGKTSITRARLERNLPVVFSNLYVQQAKLLGHKGITARSLHARAQCDKGGPNVADHGPGADWICLMSWHDPNIDETNLPGKFEVNVHSNDCYTAGGPSKIVGLLTITDTHGNTVDNPVFEFDSCFSPKSSNRPTGVMFPTTSTTSTPAAPASALSLPSGLARTRGGKALIRLTCSDGSGCAGTLGRGRGRARVTLGYAIRAGRTQTVRLPAVAGSSRVAITVRPVIGTAPSGVNAIRLRR